MSAMGCPIAKDRQWWCWNLAGHWTEVDFCDASPALRHLYLFDLVGVCEKETHLLLAQICVAAFSSIGSLLCIARRQEDDENGWH